MICYCRGSFVLCQALNCLLHISAAITSNEANTSLLLRPTDSKETNSDSSAIVNSSVDHMLDAIRRKGGTWGDTVSPMKDYPSVTVTAQPRRDKNINKLEMPPAIEVTHQWKVDTAQRILQHLPSAYRYVD